MSVISMDRKGHADYFRIQNVAVFVGIHIL